MLQKLFVQNYALIDQLEVDFNNGLTIITGETGAGKSIILGALGLIAGNRADIQALNNKSKKCIVEGTFDIKNLALKKFFRVNELDYEDVTTIRREIIPSGKSRAFINDTPVNLTQLNELSKRLIDIHSQHQTLTLNGRDFQLSVIDSYANNDGLLVGYQQDFSRFKSLNKNLVELLEKESNAKKEQDFIQFQFNELEEAYLKQDEQEDIEQELKALNNVEEIKQNLSAASVGLNGGDINLISSFSEIKNMLNPIADYTSEIKDLYERINSSLIELKDISNEMENLEEGIHFDPSRLEELNQRIDTIYHLQQKHQVKTIIELIELKESFSLQLLDFYSLESSIYKARQEVIVLEKTLNSQAQIISDNRKKAIPSIQKDASAVLFNLAMPNAQFTIEQSRLTELSFQGRDKIVFLFSANKGVSVKELNKVASGGELSRLMLSIKSLMTKHSSLPTIIFDEIDTGVSGDVADKVGTIIEKMAEKLQVITITHLPQMASKGDSHLLVYKDEIDEKTYSNIKQLSSEERVQEIAKMLSTGTPTVTAIKNAEELLKA